MSMGNSPSCGGSLSGFFIFEYQVSYWKGGEEMDFGIMELGSNKLGMTNKAEETQWEDYPVWCVRQKRNSEGASWAHTIAEVFGGTSPVEKGCFPDGVSGRE